MSEPEITPPELTFRFQVGKQLPATINIHNPSPTDKLAFKVKTTTPKKYVVRPSSGVAEPNSTVPVQVIMQAQKDFPADFQNCKDKFLVQTTYLSAGEQVGQDTFKKEGRSQAVKEARLKVLLEGPLPPPSPVPEANETEEFSQAEPIVPDQKLKTTLGNLADATSELNALKLQLSAATKERDDLRVKLDMLQLQKGGADSGSSQAVAQKPALQHTLIIQLIVVAIIAFLIGHYT